MVCFASTKWKQSCRHCKTIDKNLHRHFLTHRSLTSRSIMPSSNSSTPTSALWCIRWHLSTQWGTGPCRDSPCPSLCCRQTFRRWRGLCVRPRPTSMPAWCICTHAKVSNKTILNPLTTQLNILTEHVPNHAVPCEFWQSTICPCSTLNKVNLHQLFNVPHSGFAINRTKLCTTD